MFFSLRWFPCALFWCSVLCLYISYSPAQAAQLHKWEANNFCKCICFQSNYTILRLDHPDNPSKPCLSCTKQWCLTQNLPICVGASLGDTNPDTATGKEGDVEARCFQRDSPRDQLVVTLFLLTVFGLLLGVSIKQRMIKAGLDINTFHWNSPHRNQSWWKAWLPFQQPEDIALPERRPNSGFSRSREHRGSYEEYEPEAESPLTR